MHTVVAKLIDYLRGSDYFLGLLKLIALSKVFMGQFLYSIVYNPLYSGCF